VRDLVFNHNGSRLKLQLLLRYLRTGKNLINDRILAVEFLINMMIVKNPEIETVICIVRHGETDWNAQGRLQGREDIELNEAGRQQALKIAGYLSGEHWDVIVSSPLKRAYETARIVANILSISKIETEEKITERDYGEASGLWPEERRKRFPDSIPGQEDFEMLRQRAMLGLEKIVNDHTGKKIVVISHGALTNSILYTLSGGEFGSFKTRLKNGCFNQITVKGGKWTVDFYNKTVE
jgi:uncharacterized phosphatase